MFLPMTLSHAARQGDGRGVVQTRLRLLAPLLSSVSASHRDRWLGPCVPVVVVARVSSVPPVVLVASSG